MKQPGRNLKSDGAAEGRSADDSVAPAAKSAASRKSAPPSGPVVCCRLPVEELEAFDGLCAELGARSRSDGLRLVARMASGFLEFSRADAEHLEAMRHELHRIGTGVNQIALAASRGRSDLVRSQWAAVDELRRALPGLRTLLGQIVAERRRQGVSLFRAYVAGKENGDG